MIFTIYNDELFSLNESENHIFPKYTSQLINWANQNAQGTRPRVVGQLSELFPEYDKALYLDCDIVVNGDIGELYSIRLGNNLVGAIVEEVMQKVDVFGTYVERVLEIPREVYFNAGVLVMNLDEIRKCDVKREFVRLIGKKRFEVTQDQDYLNVICKDKIVFVGGEWNKMPIGGAGETPKLIHYNLTMKPWHYDNILFKEHFWHYARRSEYYERILGELRAYSAEKRQKDADSEVALRALAVKEAEREDNYFKRFGK